LEGRSSLVNGRGNGWESTAKSAMIGEMHGNRPPKRRWPGRHMEIDCQIGDDRQNTWEVLKSWHGPREYFFACLRKEA
ncbi:MAG: hypothetical protein ACK5TH_15085, partial [Prosthecobacter sp.]